MNPRVDARPVSEALTEPPPCRRPPKSRRDATAALIELAADHGISELASAGPGPIGPATWVPCSDPLAPFVFQLAASELFAEVMLLR